MKIIPKQQGTDNSQAQVHTGADQIISIELKPTQDRPASLDQSEALKLISKVPGYLKIDPNNCSDLLEYGNNLNLEQSKTPDGKIVFLESQQSADKKFFSFIKESSIDNSLAGDKFLKDLLQAAVTEIEQPLTYLESIRAKKEALPFFNFSTKDSESALDEESEKTYQAFIKEQFAPEIKAYLDHSPSTRTADDYVERIRRILRVNAGQINQEALPKHISEAWQKVATKNSLLTRRNFIRTGVLGTLAAAGAAGTLSYRNNSIEQEAINEEITGKSILDGDTFPKLQTKDQIAAKLMANEKVLFLRMAKILEKQLKDQGFIEPEFKYVFSIIDNKEVSNLDIFKSQGLIHIRLTNEIFKGFLDFNSPQVKSAELNKKRLGIKIKSHGVVNLKKNKSIDL